VGAIIAVRIERAKVTERLKADVLLAHRARLR
jgi:hypothetical protein